MPNSELPLVDRFNLMLSEEAGLHRKFCDQCPRGAPGHPSVLLEVNASFARVLPQEIMRERNLIYMNLGQRAEGPFDVTIECPDVTQKQDGLDGVELDRELPEGSRLGSVIIAHQCEQMSAENLAEWVVTAALKIPEGGKVYVIDEHGWLNKDGLLQAAAATIRGEFGKTVAIERVLIAPAVTRRLGLRIASTSDAFQIAEIYRSIAETRDGFARVCTIPISQPIGTPYRAAGNTARAGNFILVPKYGDEVITIAKLTPEQMKHRKEAKRKMRK